MRFVLSYTRGSLFSIGDKIQKEGHQVAKGHTTANGTLLISDVPLDPVKCNGEGIGVSRFTLLMAKSREYEESIKLAAGLQSSIVFPHLPDTRKEIEFSIGCWFNGIDFVYPVFGIVDDTYFMDRDRGYPCIMGSTVRIFKEPPKVFMEGMWKLKTCLRSANFKGFMMINYATFMKTTGESYYGIVNIYPHFKADSIYAILESMQEEVGRTLVEIFNGGKKSIRYCRYGYSIAIRISVPPYPYPQLPFESYHKDIKGYCSGNAKHIWLREVDKDKEGKLRVAGSIIGVVTARGDTIKECRRRAYRTISNLDIEWLQYRQDIGMKASEILPNLS